MGKADNDGKKKGGCLGKLAVIVALAGLGGLGAAVYFISQTQDLSDIEGRGPTAVGKTSRSLARVMKNAFDGGYQVTLSEEEINLFLRDSLESKQGGVLADQVKIEDVVVRLEDDRAEIVIVRDVAGHPLTLSMYLRVEQIEQPDGRISTRIYRDGGPFHESVPKPAVGGRFGKLPVPEGFLLLVLPSFEQLAGLLRTPAATRGKPVKELDFVEEMTRIRIEEGKLVLDPAPNMKEMPMRGGGQ